MLSKLCSKNHPRSLITFLLNCNILNSSLASIFVYVANSWQLCNFDAILIQTQLDSQFWMKLLQIGTRKIKRRYLQGVYQQERTLIKDSVPMEPFRNRTRELNWNRYRFHVICFAVQEKVHINESKILCLWVFLQINKIIGRYKPFTFMGAK